MSTLPSTPEELLEELFAIFPDYRSRRSGEPEGECRSYPSILREFACFFGAELDSFSESQLRSVGALVNKAVAEAGPLEKAFSTCFLEHLHQIRASRVLGPHLSKLARSRSHA